METPFSRTELIYGADALPLLSSLHIAVFGVGGVGSYAAEALARTGVGELTLVDFDEIAASNLNRQLPALTSTIGKSKVDVMAKRLVDINPELIVHPIAERFDLKTSQKLLEPHYDFVLDCIDMVSSKIHLIETCIAKETPIISSMGMASHKDPGKIQVSDISKTYMCPLAKIMRKELKNRGIGHLPVVFSTEEVTLPYKKVFSESGKQINGSLAFVTGVAGMYMAAYVLNNVLGSKKSIL